MPPGVTLGGMSPCPPGFVRVVLTCRRCGEVTVLDLHPAVIASRYPGVPLARFSWRCSSCLSDDVDINVKAGAGCEAAPHTLGRA
jgi:hypothetical protein